MYAGEIVDVQHGGGFIAVQGGHAGVENRAQFRVRLKVVENRCAENFIETGLARLKGVMQAVPGGKQMVEQLRARAVRAPGVGAQGGRKRGVVEVAILGFLKQAVAGQEAEDSVEGRLMRFAGAGEMCDGLRLAGLDEIGDAELGDGADRAAQGGADQDATELFGFSLGMISS